MNLLELNQNKINMLKKWGFTPISSNLNYGLEVKCDKCGSNIKRSWNQMLKYNKCLSCDDNKLLLELNNLGYVVTDIRLSKLEIQCKNGHVFNRNKADFKRGIISCLECDELEKLEFIKSCGFTKIDVNHMRCNKCNNIVKKSYPTLKSGITFCKFCDENNKKSLLNNINLEMVDKNIFKCNKGHTFYRTYDNLIKSNNLCPECYPNNTMFEKELKEILPAYIINDYSVLGDKELDFYLPEYNLAIECNGVYWHSDKFKDKNYHLNKTEKCKEKGIQLLHIFESSWIEKKDIWKSIINNKLGKSEKIMARKCILKEVPKTEEKEFLNKNHLQGFTGSSICYGLYFNNELVCLMSFGKPRFTDKYDWELIRLCTKKNTNVIGGASKLLSYFHKNNPGLLISYSDRLYSNGEIYKQLGFTFSHFSKPGYMYTKNGRMLNRQQFMKHKLKDKLEKFDPNLTESENMSINGYYKIWDCGQGVWVKS
ncbi:homing endonuclease [Campylobacter phage CP30A]|uniref:Putative Hef-like homing endonuclease n=1 Tax=Campylobacter phage CP30A TaxID=1229752 RepID=J9RWW8_9CAUD|nr:homing endonuclease [Campylobacter phage CP30A]AFR52397.1 putative Hef-like homing endonuclease [Campylobacter phage CP30A]